MPYSNCIYPHGKDSRPVLHTACMVLSRGCQELMSCSWRLYSPYRSQPIHVIPAIHQPHDQPHDQHSEILQQYLVGKFQGPKPLVSPIQALPSVRFALSLTVACKASSKLVWIVMQNNSTDVLILYDVHGLERTATPSFGSQNSMPLPMRS